MTTQRLLPLIFAAAIAFASGCGTTSETPSAARDAKKGGALSATTSKAGAEAPAALPDSLFAAEPIPGAKPLSEARASAKKGDALVFTGYVGGRREPFVAGRAIMLVADIEAAPACAEGEGCATPWDACCTPIETKTANSATIQVVGADGQPLKIGLDGAGPLKPGAKVAVAGTVREVAPDIFIVDATSISGV